VSMVSKYSMVEDLCPSSLYRLLDSENYSFFLFLPHTGLRPSTHKTNEQIVANGKQFTKEKHFNDETLTAILYRSEPLTINHNEDTLQYTWTAYLTADNDIGIEDGIMSEAEYLLGRIEIEEINTEDKSLCEIKKESLQ